MVAAKDDITTLKNEVAEIKNTVNTWCEEFKAKIDDAIFGN